LHIREVKIVNFRNYSELKLEFSKNYNFIYGNNAQGKTNIIEALFLCSSGKSYRANRDEELIKFNENSYYIKLLVESKETEKIIEVAYNVGERKKIKINSVPIKKSGELMGQITEVLFSPEHISIVKEGPQERRRFIDIAISQLKPAYYYDLQQYSKLLTQKNHLLRDLKNSKKRNMRLWDTLEIWNDKLAETGTRIMMEREKYLYQLDKIANEIHIKLTGGAEKMRLKYKPSLRIDDINHNNHNEIKQLFIENVRRDEEKEIFAGITLWGPQRDDVEIEINGRNLRIYGSQGQQRTGVITLKFSELEILKELANEEPVFLLDDIFSELDKRRQDYIIDMLNNTQTFITNTRKIIFDNIHNVQSNLNYYYVENGKVIME